MRSDATTHQEKVNPAPYSPGICSEEAPLPKEGSGRPERGSSDQPSLRVIKITGCHHQAVLADRQPSESIRPASWAACFLLYSAVAPDPSVAGNKMNQDQGDGILPPPYSLQTKRISRVRSKPSTAIGRSMILPAKRIKTILA